MARKKPRRYRITPAESAMLDRALAKMEQLTPKRAAVIAFTQLLNVARRQGS